ncbi:hypothetical protein C0J52_15534 [Blattella germanica]|nr:hypothetical protein C0J52_15534 [Blattella germanica]
MFQGVRQNFSVMVDLEVRPIIVFFISAALSYYYYYYYYRCIIGNLSHNFHNKLIIPRMPDLQFM